ncbi:MAG TPA: Yip1 family protein [Caldimonas sp.]
MSLIERVQPILVRPKQTWPVIAAEGGDAASIFTGYVMILAAIPAVAAFIGLTLVGVGGFGVSYRLPVLAGLVQMIVSYLLTLAMVFVLALLVNGLAPTFGGTKDSVRALKLVAYGTTASFLGGIFNLIPMLSLLGVLASLYSIYLIYTGIAVMMRCPPDKAGAYTAVVIVCGIVASVVIIGVAALVTPGRGGGLAGIATGMANGTAGGPPGNVTIKAPDGTSVTINPGAMAEMAKRMEEAGKRMEEAQKSGDSAAAGKAAGEVMGALTGGSGKPIASADLKTMLPESVGDLKRTGIEASSGEAMGIAGSSAKATYANGDRNLTLSITDTGGLAGLAAMAGWANMTVDKETDGKVEKVYKDGARTVHEEYLKDGSHGELTVILANGVIVDADGNRVDVDTLKKVLAGLDLARIEAMKRPAK